MPTEQQPYTGVMLRCAITDVSGIVGAAARRDVLLACAARWAQQRIDFVQLREKELPAGELVELAAAMMLVFGEHGGRTKLLLNHRVDVALSAGADGVHLTSYPDEMTPGQAHEVFALAGKAAPIVGVSCHTLNDVQRAGGADADLILFGPVFEKRVNLTLVHEGCGLAALRKACGATKLPVLALGGVTQDNTSHCLEAGAAGIAAIRMFQH